MGKNWRILHLTDFHIAKPTETDEHLREGYFREYIEGLAKSLGSSQIVGSEALDAIVITGDFVDRGQLGNFSHVHKIIEYLCKCLSVSPSQVFVCNGNHDIDRLLEQASDLEGARRIFSDFAKGFGNGLAEYSTIRSTLTKSESGVHALMVDSTIGAAGDDRAGSISTQEVDEIVALVRDIHLSANDLLIVATHHPPNAAFRINGPFDETNTKWFEKHIWALGHPLLTRLQETATGPVLWLSGDIHKPAFVIDNTIHSVVTGRFGGSVTGPKSQVRRQARVILIPQDGDSQSWLFEYVPHGHVDHPQDGQWEMKVSPPEKHTRPTVGVPSPSTYTRSAAADRHTVDVGVGRESARDEGFAFSSSQLHLLSSQLQAEVLQVIADEDLYSLGRFITSKSESTLAWIPMGSLMDQGELLVSVINEMTKWLGALLAKENPDDPVIIGIDSWGAILASQLSVTTGVRNFCIAGRAQGITHSTSERISDTVTAAVAKSDLIVLITDVIGTGRSLRHVYEALAVKMTQKQQERAKWAVLSVICDENHCRGDTLAFASANATACKDLRMPILADDMLPSVEILPPDISFLRS